MSRADMYEVLELARKRCEKERRARFDAMVATNLAKFARVLEGVDLSPRERDVLQWLASFDVTDEMAELFRKLRAAPPVKP